MSTVVSGGGDQHMEWSTPVPPVDSWDIPPDQRSPAPLLKHNPQILASLSPSPVDMSGRHLAVDVQSTAPAEADGDGSNRPDGGLIMLGRPAARFTLAFVDLTYSVRRPRMMSSLLFRRHEATGTDDTAARTLLDGVCGEAREGEILAVLGASGSGKSTLIDALAGRIQRDSLGGGAVTLNGEALDGGGRDLLRVISAHVMQDDLLHPMLTVAETLMYSAEFRLPRSLPASRKRGRVQALIDQLGLRAAAHTIIGDEGRRGVSGGERRRVSIGIDIVHDPIVLFLDEPTSGLDSASAFKVVKVLQRVAQSGSVVVMSIHQPSYRILGLLDRLLLLSRGRTVYYGPPAGLPPFFSEFGRPIPRGENPAEFALDTIRELEHEHEHEHGGSAVVMDRLVELSKSWRRQQTTSRATTVTMLSVKDAIGVSVARGKLVSGANAEVATYANPWWVEVWVLTRRGFTSTWRTPELFLVRLGAVTITALVLATVFWRLDSTPKGVTERFGFFVVAMSTMFYASADALPVFLVERHIFLRETAHNAYRRSSYTLSNAIVAFPPLVLLSAAFATIGFFSVGLTGGFAFFFLVILASFWAGSGFATFLSVVIPHVVMGYAVAVGVLAYFLLYSGYYVTRERIPAYWVWFHYLSLIKYPYQAVMQNEFGAVPDRCFMRGVQMFDGTPMGRLPEATKVDVLNAISRAMRVDFNSTSCILSGADILANQAVTDLGKWTCLWVTVAWGFIFRALFYITLVLGTNNSRS